MKHMRKLVTLVIVLAMVMAFMVPAAFADGMDGKITVNNAISGQTYNIYRIFDLSYSGFAYNYSISTKWTGFFGANAAGEAYIGDTETEFPIVVNNTTKYIQITNNNADEFAAAARQYIADNNIANDGTATANGTSVVFENLAYGYYLLDTTTGTLCSLNTAAKEVTISDKSTAPTISKTVEVTTFGQNSEGEDSTTVNIGTPIEYKIKITVGDGAQNYVFVDELPNFVTFAEGTTNVLGVTPEISGNKVTFDWSNTTLTKGDVLWISLVCYVNENAVSGTSGNVNTAYLYYGEDGDDADTLGDLSVSDSATVYTYSFDLVKTDENNVLLPGATFSIYNSETDNTPINLIKVSDTEYRIPSVDNNGNIIGTPVTQFEVTSGMVTISGLKGNTTYYVGEITPPTGYNPLTERKSITIESANNNATVTDGSYTSGGLQVINRSGTVLPSTGGMGTTIFYILGSLMVVGAAVVLVTNKRMRGQM